MRSFTNDTIDRMPNTPNPEVQPSQPTYLRTMENSQNPTNERVNSQLNSDRQLLDETNNVTQSVVESSPVKQAYSGYGEFIRSERESKTISRENSLPVSH